MVSSYVYNAENKRVQSRIDNRLILYTYDHQGRMTFSYKLHDGETAERLYLESGQALAKWTNHSDGTLTYLHTDHLGTPLRGTKATFDTNASTSGSATDLAFIDHSTPFGLNPTSAWHGNAGSGFDPATGPGSNCGVTGFTTHVKDCATGLQYMQARYYDPGLARFTSVDPVTFIDKSYPGQINRYSYTWNNPINAIDPDGRETRLMVEARHLDRAVTNGSMTMAERNQISRSQLSGAAAGAAVLIPGPEDVVIAGAAATKVGQTLKTAIGAKRAAKTCCFIAGTLVETENGLRPIEEVKIGDRVWARDTETGETSLKPVTNLIRRHQRIIWIVEVEGFDEFGNIISEQFETTDDHPWWIVEKTYQGGLSEPVTSFAKYTQSRHGPKVSSNVNGRWVDTDALSVGMTVVSRRTNGKDLKLSVVSVRKTARIEPTYNLTVADYGTYFVGDSKILVHNCGGNQEITSMSAELKGEFGEVRNVQVGSNPSTSIDVDIDPASKGPLTTTVGVRNDMSDAEQHLASVIEKTTGENEVDGLRAVVGMIVDWFKKDS